MSEDELDTEAGYQETEMLYKVGTKIMRYLEEFSKNKDNKKYDWESRLALICSEIAEIIRTKDKEHPKGLQIYPTGKQFTEDDPDLKFPDRITKNQK